MIPRGGSVVFEVHVGESRAARDRTREGSRVLPENRRRLGRAERGDGESTVRSKRLHRAGRDAIEPRDGEEHDRRGRVGLSVVEKVVHLADEVGVPPPEDEGGAGVGVRVGRRLGGDDRLSDPRERLPMEEVPVHVVLIPDETQLLRRASAVGRRPRARVARVRRVPSGLRRVAGEVSKNPLRVGQPRLRLSGGGASFKVPSRGVDVLALDEAHERSMKMSARMRSERDEVGVLVAPLRSRRHVDDEFADARSDARALAHVAQRHRRRQELLAGRLIALLHVHEASRIRDADRDYDSGLAGSKSISWRTRDRAERIRGGIHRRLEVDCGGETRRETAAAQAELAAVKVTEDFDRFVESGDGRGGNLPPARSVEETCKVRSRWVPSSSTRRRGVMSPDSLLSLRMFRMCGPTTRKTHRATSRVRSCLWCAIQWSFAFSFITMYARDTYSRRDNAWRRHARLA